MAVYPPNDVDIFEDRDLLDVAVEEYEEKVPLLGQIGLGITPVGPVIDIAESAKYGRQGLGELSAGLGALTSPISFQRAGPLLSSGAKNIGIAGLAALGIIPVVGDIAKRYGKGLIKGLDATKADDIVPISSIQKATDKVGKVIQSPITRVDQAEKLLKTATSEFNYKGVTQPKRQPIAVVVKSDGSLEQIGGKSTLEALERSGVENVPITKFGSKGDYVKTEYVRKANKEAKRLEDAKKLVPTKGNPTFEGPVRSFGAKMEKALDKQVNLHQGHIKSADELFDSAKRINPVFQDEIEALARKKGYTTVQSPGEAITDPDLLKHLDPDSRIPIDLRTGNFPGTVKLKPRIIEKASQKYFNDVSQITDSIRSRIVTETTQQADDMANEIALRFPTKDSGNQVNMFGYRDRKLNIQYTHPETGEKIIGEISLVSTPMHEAAIEAHEFFKPWRSISEQFKNVDDMPRDIYFEWKNLKGRQQYIFNKSYELLDPSWRADDIVKKFALGGAVYGSSGSVSPRTPNVFSNSSLVSSPPFSPISPYCPPDALTQSEPPTGIKKALVTPSSGKSPIIAGPRSQDKYDSSAMVNSIQNNTNKSMDIPIKGGRKEIL
jgi:hypothetical protein